MADTWGAATPPPNDVVEHVLDVVRQLARETGGSRAERAVSAQASLEREVGLGSLERVELMARLERAFARPLDTRRPPVRIALEEYDGPGTIGWRLPTTANCRRAYVPTVRGKKRSDRGLRAKPGY